MEEKLKNLNWGRNIYVKPKISYPKNLNELKKLSKNNFMIIGGGRSYGDVAINNENLVSLKKFNKIISFDKKNGKVEVESGLILIDLLKIITKNNWFIPVTPGSKYVSIGGMVANNTHGKNIKNNQIKKYIKNIKIIDQKNKIILCSKNKNKNYLTLLLEDLV